MSRYLLHLGSTSGGSPTPPSPASPSSSSSAKSSSAAATQPPSVTVSLPIPAPASSSSSSSSSSSAHRSSPHLSFFSTSSPSIHIDGPLPSVRKSSKEKERKLRRGSSDLNERMMKPSSPPSASPEHHNAETASGARRSAQVGREDFVFLRLLGRGDVGRVYLVRHKETNRLYAMKVLPKEEMIKRNKIKRCQTEREILSQSNHPFVMTLFWCFQTPNCLYFVMEYCAGGEFFRALLRQPNRCLTEEGARFYGAEVLLALEYLHYMGFIYRDLKPENILLHASGHIVLTDFDLSKSAATSTMRMISTWNEDVLSIKPELATTSFVGTEEYIAPEVITGTVQTGAVDWWTFGILLYEMMFGTTPFRGKTRETTFRQILAGDIAFPDKPSVSKNAKEIIKKLLVGEPAHRLGSQNGAADLRKHPFFKPVKWQMIRNQKPPIVPTLRGPDDTSYFPAMKDDGYIDRLESGNTTRIDESLFQDFTTVSRGPCAYQDVPCSPTPSTPTATTTTPHSTTSTSASATPPSSSPSTPTSPLSSSTTPTPTTRGSTEQRGATKTPSPDPPQHRRDSKT